MRDSDSDSSSDDGSDWDESEEESDDEEGTIMDLDMCPPGCDQGDYDNTVAQREKRLDVEDEMAEEKKLLEVWRKEVEALTKKQRVVEIGLNQAEAELEAFQVMLITVCFIIIQSSFLVLSQSLSCSVKSVGSLPRPPISLDSCHHICPTRGVIRSPLCLAD
ncbi:unnamed protein product [Protopolystoma xenopodis]|uniref:Uncharacterized protein n=1 Tax=Protopolystoma xenopodis TaxID=117903 RepID=A0A448XKZ7_9PLAT|nr:unnamed protein product [Protopolystoma xenopodis]